MLQLKRSVLFSVVCCVLALPCAQPVLGAGNAARLQQEVEELEKRLADAQAQLKQAEEERELLRRKAELENQVTNTQAAVAAAGRSKAGAAARTYTNSIGMEFVLIPAGTFRMGCFSDDEPCKEDERPRHQVTISQAFYLGQYEVTQEQWQAVMGNNPSKFKGPDRPVERVSWNDVQEFIKRLNQKEGHNRYRLPTEAEWEYAARAGSTTAYSFGNGQSDLYGYAWFEGNSGKKTHHVGQKKPNAWGLYDMHGNVWEWVADRYGPYRGVAVTDPQGPSTDGHRVVRGGSWYSIAGYCRAARRSWGPPGTRSDDWGVRLALSPGH